MICFIHPFLKIALQFRIINIYIENTMNPTTRSYRRFAKVAIQNWNLGRKKRRIPPFLKKILMHPLIARNPCRILDLGCGPGLDSVIFAALGHTVIGVDSVPEFIRYARSAANRLRPSRPGGAGKSGPGRLRFYLLDFNQALVASSAVGCLSFDLIWANASLIHLPKSRLSPILKRLRARLLPGGFLAATLFHGKGESVYQGSFVPGRFFARYGKSELAAHFARAGWRVCSLQTVANQDRKGRWLNIIAESAEHGQK